MKKSKKSKKACFAQPLTAWTHQVKQNETREVR